MAIYKVGCNNTEYFTIYIDAESASAAISNAYKRIEQEGTPFDAEIFEREFDAIAADLA